MTPTRVNSMSAPRTHLSRTRAFATVVTATVLAACGASDAPPMAPGPPAPTESVRLSGTIVTADRAPLPPLQIAASSAVDTVVLGSTPDGSFALTVDRSPGDPVSLLISGTDEPWSAYLPSLKFFEPEEETEGLVAMLVPARYTIPAGIDAGLEVTTSLQAAIAPENQPIADGDGSFFYVSRWVRTDSNPPSFGEAVDPGRSLWTNAWNSDRLPLPLYFEHTGVTLQGEDRAPVSAADSITIWNAIDDLEARFGMDLFAPARAADVPVDTIRGSPEPRPVRLFSISLEMVPDLAAPGALAGFAGAEASCQPFSGDACERFGPGELYTGSVKLSAFVGSPPDVVRALVQHELIHALGFGHACFRPSVMARCSGPYAGVIHEEGGPVPLATRFDVAYIGWYRMIHEATVRLRPHLGILEALDGERRVRLGRPPVPVDLRCTWGETEGACDFSGPGSPPVP